MIDKHEVIHAPEHISVFPCWIICQLILKTLLISLVFFLKFRLSKSSVITQLDCLATYPCALTVEPAQRAVPQDHRSELGVIPSSEKHHIQ